MALRDKRKIKVNWFENFLTKENFEPQHTVYALLRLLSQIIFSGLSPPQPVEVGLTNECTLLIYKALNMWPSDISYKCKC